MHPRRVALVLSAVLFVLAMAAGVVRWTSAGDDAPAESDPTNQQAPERSPHALDPDGDLQPTEDPGTLSEPPGQPGG